jgi:hypothetical protein
VASYQTEREGGYSLLILEMAAQTFDALELSEIARVLVRLDHVASVIVNAS